MSDEEWHSEYEQDDSKWVDEAEEQARRQARAPPQGREMLNIRVSIIRILALLALIPATESNGGHLVEQNALDPARCSDRRFDVPAIFGARHMAYSQAKNRPTEAPLPSGERIPL